MMGGAPWWPIPSDVTTDQYIDVMSSHMKRMQEQMRKIAQTTDPQERELLLQEHWRYAYEGMQTMRGRGWMWGCCKPGPGTMGPRMMGPGMMGWSMMPLGPAPSATPLPDSGGAGARLVSAYCTQCHAAPMPSLHTATEWSSVTQRMHIRMEGGWPGVKAPTEQEMQSILGYMQEHSRR